MNIVAIDPGSSHSGITWLQYDEFQPDRARFPTALVRWEDAVENNYVLNSILCLNPRRRKTIIPDSDRMDVVVVEVIAPQRQPYGWDVANTSEAAIRFSQRSFDIGIHRPVTMQRSEVRTVLCGHVACTNLAVETTVIDYFGPGQEAAVGTKKKPGQLYGLQKKNKHAWAALSLGVAWIIQFERTPLS